MIHSIPYSLALIARSGTHFTGFGPYVPSIADDGSVAFQARLRSGACGVFVAQAGTLFSLAESGHEGLGAVISHPDLNARGESCFYAELLTGGQALCLTRDGDLLRLAETDSDIASIGPLGPTLNASGQAAFRARLRSGASGIFRADRDGVRLLAESGERFTGFQGLPVIDACGRVLLRADLPAGEGIYLAEGEELMTVAETGSEFTALGRFPSLSEEGDICFSAELASGGSGLFRARQGSYQPLCLSGEAFAGFRGVLPGPGDHCVFYASLPDGRLGIFTGPDPIHDRLLLMGEPCFGAPVSDFALNPVSVNTRGQLALRVSLSDGIELILRADPDPPAFRLTAGV